MTLELAMPAFLWCAVINYALLLLWVLLSMLPHQRFYLLVGKRFHLTAELFDTINFALIGLYKVGIILFNLVPYISLRIIR
jgi:hypothetical protein